MIKYVGTVSVAKNWERLELRYKSCKNEILKGIVTSTEKARFSIIIDGVDTFIADFRCFDNNLKTSPNEKYLKLNKELDFEAIVSLDRLSIEDEEEVDVFFVTEIKSNASNKKIDH